MKKGSRQILLISEITFKNITILLLCVFIGIKLDEYFNTKPLWIIIFSVLALGYLVVSLFMLGREKNEL